MVGLVVGNKRVGNGFSQSLTRVSGTGPASQVAVAAGAQENVDVVIALEGSSFDPTINVDEVFGLTDGISLVGVEVQSISVDSVTIRVRVNNQTAGSINVAADAVTVAVSYVR